MVDDVNLTADRWIGKRNRLQLAALYFFGSQWDGQAPQ
jgi:hypothetical protein